MSKSHPPEIFIPGTYKVIRPDTEHLVLDLSGSDLKSIIVFPHHGGANQQWEIACLGAGYSLANAYNREYLTLESGLHEGASVIATPYPVSWVLERDNLEADIWRICWPNSQLVIARRNDDAGKSQLTNRYPFDPCHLWRFVRVKERHPVNPSEKTSSLINERAVDTPSTTKADTVIDAEGLKIGANGELQITTTTTTTTVTVTKVMRLTPAQD